MPACAADRRRRTATFLALILLAGASVLAKSPPASAETEIPLPPPRPDAQAAPAGDLEAKAAEVPLPPPRPPEMAAAPAAADTEADLIEDIACHERLVQLGVRFEPLSPIVNGACGARRPIRVLRLSDGIEIAPPVTLTCDAAEALARWSAEVVTAEAARHLEAKPSRIAIGTSYECRGQNHRPDAKLSEHAFANGIDVSGFEFGKGKSITVGALPAEAPEGRFLAAVRGGACTHFTTVLGPGSDAAHGDHLHLDMRGRKAGYRICQ
jgi:hypothetical protein